MQCFSLFQNYHPSQQQKVTHTHTKKNHTFYLLSQTYTRKTLFKQNEIRVNKGSNKQKNHARNLQKGQNSNWKQIKTKHTQKERIQIKKRKVMQSRAALKSHTHNERNRKCWKIAQPEVELVEPCPIWRIFRRARVCVCFT